jgi:DNA ligase (NAD+)
MKDRIQNLRKELHQHNHNYHVLARPTITDEHYDQLFKELRDLEKAFPEFNDPNSPTSRVGGASIDTFDKIKHAVPMLSLENTFTSSEVVSFFQSKVPGREDLLGVAEPKIDGLSMSLMYECSKLVRATTRGDGTTGDDVTANVRTIPSVPLVLGKDFSGEIRGEVYMSRKQFEKLNAQLEKEGDELFANPRNAAAGSIKRKNPAEVAARKLSFIAYHYRPVGSHLIGPDDSHSGVLEYLNKLGFLTPASIGANIFVNLRERDQVEKIVSTYKSVHAAHLDFDIDGLVFKINSLKLQEELGLNNRAPNWATSYKFPPEQKVTKLIGITVQVGRLGTLTPVAELQPVNLAGTTIKRASLHNQDEIQRLGINIGDDVIIQKAAEIIPQVVGLANKRSQGVWSMPERCPCCNSVTSRLVNMVATVCTSRMCKDQVLARLEHAVKKQSLDIDGCGEQTVKALVDRGINGLPGLFALDDFSFLGDSAARRLKAGIEKAKSAPLWRKLHALGIEGIGVTTCKELATRWSSLADMLDHMDDVASILGPVTFGNFKQYVESEENLSDLERLIQLGVTFEEERKSGPLVGKVFVITGGMVSGSREEVSAKIESLGGTMKSSVSKKVHYLVVGEGAGANKSTSAQKLGTKCISEQELYDMMGLPMTLAIKLEFEE